MNRPRLKRTRDANPIAEMWGDNAVHAPACFVATYLERRNGVGRTMIGGTVLSDFCLTEKWERWLGTMIFIPTHIEFCVGQNGMTINQMMTGPLSYPGKDAGHEDANPFWKTKWKKP